MQCPGTCRWLSWACTGLQLVLDWCGQTQHGSAGIHCLLPIRGVAEGLSHLRRNFSQGKLDKFNSVQAAHKLCFCWALPLPSPLSTQLHSWQSSEHTEGHRRSQTIFHTQLRHRSFLCHRWRNRFGLRQDALGIMSYNEKMNRTFSSPPLWRWIYRWLIPASISSNLFLHPNQQIKKWVLFLADICIFIKHSIELFHNVFNDAHWQPRMYLSHGNLNWQSCTSDWKGTTIPPHCCILAVSERGWTSNRHFTIAECLPFRSKFFLNISIFSSIKIIFMSIHA